MGLEKQLRQPVWLLVQDSERYGELDRQVSGVFRSAKKDLPATGGVALVVDSYGGYAKDAYQLARMLQHYCQGFTAIVPRRAKSAATLLVLGANRLIMHPCGELGPLDAQIPDLEREQMSSALDEVQSLERLNAFAMQAVDELMFLLAMRTRRRTDVLLPMVMKFVSDMMHPLLDKIDTVHYTQTSRQLKVGEEYAIRLLQSRYAKDEARRIASQIVGGYPEHGFAIEPGEARDLLGLQVEEPTLRQEAAMDVMLEYMDGMTAIGRVQEA